MDNESPLLKKFSRALKSAKTFLFLVTLLALAAVVSCKKESSIVGLDVQPKGDLLNVGFKDSMSLYSLTQKMDSSYGLQSNPVLFGTSYDPVFGITTANFYTQVRIPNNQSSLSLGDSLTFDSLVLVLPYNNTFYGSITEQQTVEVYKVAEDFPTPYYSNKVLLSGGLLGSKTFIPKISSADSVAVGGAYQAPHLRIRLNDAYGKDSLMSQSGNPSGAFADNTAFLKFLKGLYIKSTTSGLAPGQGGIIKFNILDPLTGIQLYYKKKIKKVSGADSLYVSTSFTFETKSGLNLSQFQHDYTKASMSIQKQLNKTDTADGQQYVYLEGLSGLRLKISFPYLKNLTDSGAVVINRAEIVMKVDSSAYSAPPQLQALYWDDALKRFTAIDDLFESGYSPGGSYDASRNEYRIVVSRHLQEILNGKIKSREIYLFPVTAQNADHTLLFYPGRAVLHGASNPVNRMKLRLTYTKLH